MEDGHEYIDRSEQFLSDEFEFTRAGHGTEALELLVENAYDLIYFYAEVLDLEFRFYYKLCQNLSAKTHSDQ